MARPNYLEIVRAIYFYSDMNTYYIKQEKLIVLPGDVYRGFLDDIAEQIAGSGEYPKNFKRENDIIYYLDVKIRPDWEYSDIEWQALKYYDIFRNKYQDKVLKVRLPNGQILDRPQVNI